MTCKRCWMPSRPRFAHLPHSPLSAFLAAAVRACVRARARASRLVHPVLPGRAGGGLGPACPSHYDPDTSASRPSAAARLHRSRHQPVRRPLRGTLRGCRRRALGLPRRRRRRRSQSAGPPPRAAAGYPQWPAARMSGLGHRGDDPGGCRTGAAESGCKGPYGTEPPRSCGTALLMRCRGPGVCPRTGAVDSPCNRTAESPWTRTLDLPWTCRGQRPRTKDVHKAVGQRP
jgi:hypothetical protein